MSFLRSLLSLPSSVVTDTPLLSHSTFDQTMGFCASRSLCLVRSRAVTDEDTPLADEGLYAMFGVLQAIFSFAIGVATTLIGYNISRELHSAAITGVMRAPMSFFDTTPLGRIMNRFSKDIDTIDNTLNDSFRMFVSTLAGVLGSVVLIAIVQPCPSTFPPSRHVLSQSPN